MHISEKLVCFSSLLASIPLSSSLPSARAMKCCSEIAAKTQVTIRSWPTSQYNSDYTYAKTHYWSNTNADCTPACVVFPTSAQDVSAIVQVLLRYPDVGFATKSGGHNANVGFSSTDGGVLISMSQMTSTTISPDMETAYLSPGARWMDAVGALEPYNVTVVGGRLGTSPLSFQRKHSADFRRGCRCWRPAYWLRIELFECPTWLAL